MRIVIEDDGRVSIGAYTQSRGSVLDAEVVTPGGVLQGGSWGSLRSGISSGKRDHKSYSARKKTRRELWRPKLSKGIDTIGILIA